MDEINNTDPNPPVESPTQPKVKSPVSKKRQLILVIFALLTICIIGVGLIFLDYLSTPQNKETTQPINNPPTSPAATTTPQEEEDDEEDHNLVTCQGIDFKIVEEELYCTAAYGDVPKYSIQASYPDGRVENLFSTTNPVDVWPDKATKEDCDLFGEHLGNLSVSPNCEHVYFDMYSWEMIFEHIINVESKEFIFKSRENFGWIDEIIWSPDNSKYVILESPDERYWGGTRAIHASDPLNIDKFSLVWKSENDPEYHFLLNGIIYDVRFINNDQVEFKTGRDPEINSILEVDIEDHHFLYTFSTGELQELQ